MSGRLTRGVGARLVVLSAIVFGLASASEALAAPKRGYRKLPKKAPVTAPAAPATPAPAPAPVVREVAPTPAVVPSNTPNSILIVVEGTNARDLDIALRRHFDERVVIAAPAQVRAAVTSAEQHVFDRPRKKADLVRAMRRVGNRAGVDAVVYANVGGSAGAGYVAAVLVVYRTGRLGAEATVPVSEMIRKGGRQTLAWRLENVVAVVQPAIDALSELPARGAPPGTSNPSAQPGSTGGPSLSDALAGFEARRGQAAPAGMVEAQKSMAEGEMETVSDEIEVGPSLRGSLFQRRMESPLVVKVGMAGAHRQFAYNQPITSNLRDYSLGLAPLVTLELEAYPFANTSVPVLANIGWYASYDRAFAVESSFRTVTAENDVRVGNDWSTWQVGLHSRFRVARWLGLGPQATYGFSAYRFEFTDVADQRAFEVPDVRYNFLRLGLEARMPVTFLDLTAGLGYRALMSGGRVASQYFPNSQTGAVDAYASIGLPIAGPFALDGTVRYVRYFYDLRPEVGDTYVAGGALDQYLTASLSVVYIMGGHKE